MAKHRIKFVTTLRYRLAISIVTLNPFIYGNTAISIIDGRTKRFGRNTASFPGNTTIAPPRKKNTCGNTRRRQVKFKDPVGRNGEA